jgi:nucleoid-associated protein YgaU
LGEKLIIGEWRGQIAVLTITICLMAIGINNKGEGAVLALVGRNDELIRFVAMRNLNTSNGVVLSSTDEVQLDQNSPTYHKVQPGDNLWDIAESYYSDGTKWILIRDANLSVNKNSLKVGQELIIPGL